MPTPTTVIMASCPKLFAIDRREVRTPIAHQGGYNRKEPPFRTALYGIIIHDVS